MIFKKKKQPEEAEQQVPEPEVLPDLSVVDPLVKKKKLWRRKEKPAKPKKEIKPKKEKAKKAKKEKQPKKKSEEYVIKKNGLMKFLRVVFWGILLFIFVNGIIVLTRPDRTDEVKVMIDEFEQRFYEQKDSNEEILGFAQNFAKEYLTYTRSGEADFRNRISPYVSDRIFNMTGIYDFKKDAEAVYVSAYRKEAYSDQQWDVYVMCHVQYKKNTVNKNGEEEEVLEQKRSVLKVPISMSNGGYCVEDLPLFVEDYIRDAGHQEIEYYGTEIKNPKIEQALTNFLQAYYKQEQSVIDYYLTVDADKTKFYGLNGRYEFMSIDNIKSYQEEGQKEIICILKIKIKDTVNEGIILQEFNVVVIEDGDRIYVQDLNTKIVNLYNKF